MHDFYLTLLSIEAGYWIFLKFLLYFCSIYILISGIDDLIIDLCYWFRKAYGLFLRKYVDPHRSILDQPEKPIAIMIPAWGEHQVIAQMLQATIKRFKYSEYKIFVGTYPNDTETQSKVDQIAEKYPQIIKVINDKAGPSTKADCLNNIIKALFEYEIDNNMCFQIITYHDAEDMVHPLELKLFNTCIPKYDMVQIPILPLGKKWYHWTGGTYIDEFTEYQEKDVKVREFLTGNVCSAGVGTAFSRNAIVTLNRINKGKIFNTTSLTEDYEFSYILHQKQFKQHFEWYATSGDHMPYLAVRAYFPFNMRKAIKQKSRWMIGIIFQGWKNIGWPIKQPALCYFLLRDRKGLISNLVNLLAYFIVLNIVFEHLVLYYWLDLWQLPSLVSYQSLIWYLLLLNGLIFLNRTFHRFYFVLKHYNIKEALLAVPRLLISNIINFCALITAISKIKSNTKSKKTISWDKTEHEFPDFN